LSLFRSSLADFPRRDCGEIAKSSNLAICAQSRGDGPLALLAFGTAYTDRIDMYRNTIDAAAFATSRVEARPRTLLIAMLSARRTGVRTIIGHAEAMGVKVAAAVLATATGLGLLATAPSSPASDEDQVRAVLYGMNGSYNRTDFDAFASHLCAGMLQAEGFKAGWYKSREVDGPTRITVNSVNVKGNNAVANVRFEAAHHEHTKTLDLDFVRESSEWKACRYHVGQTV
jgi:hypothetical protein